MCTPFSLCRRAIIALAGFLIQLLLLVTIESVEGGDPCGAGATCLHVQPAIGIFWLVMRDELWEEGAQMKNRSGISRPCIINVISSLLMLFLNRLVECIIKVQERRKLSHVENYHM